MTTMPARGGPYVKGAFLCETVIEGKDGVNSYIRIVDRLAVEAQVLRIGAPPPGTPRAAVPDSIPDGTVLTTWAAIMLVGGGAKGRHVVALRIRRPDGHLVDYGSPIDVHFDERLASGVNLHIEMTLVGAQEGAYELHVLVDEQEKTKVFFDVVYQRRG